MKAICCIDRNYGIGFNNKLLYKIPEDMKFFKEVTTANGVVIMGSGTFKSMGSKPLKDRINIILSRSKTVIYSKDGMMNVWNFCDTKFIASLYPNAYVIGGEDIFKAFMPYYEFIVTTEVNDAKTADRFFFQIPNNYKKILLKEYVATDKDPSFSFNMYVLEEIFEKSLSSGIIKLINE